MSGPEGKAVLRFLKSTIWRQKDLSTGSSLLDKAFKIPAQGTMLIRAEPYSGATALLLEIAERLLELGYVVLYIDIADSVLLHRIKRMTRNPNLIFAKPSSVGQLIEIVEAFADYNLAVCIDAAYLLHDKWNLYKGLHKLAAKIRGICPFSTVICTQRGNKANLSWNAVIELSFKKKRYKNRSLVGHTVLITGPYGQVEHYIHYADGRLKKSFAIAKEQNLGARGWYETATGEKIQGFWNFVDQA